MTAVTAAFAASLRTESATPAESSLCLRVSAIHEDGHAIRVFELRAAGGQALPSWTPGAHVKLMLPGGLTRCYSLCNAPGETDLYRIAVKREAASRGGSVWLHEQMQVGAQLRVSGPLNAFSLLETTQSALLFAAGIGITPIYAMAADLLHRGRAVQLHYFARSVAHAALLAPLSRPVLAPHCHFHFGLSAQETGMAITAGLAGVACTTPLYICGPAPFIEQVRTQAATLGWRATDVHFELFAAAATEVASVADTATTQDVPFELVLQRSGVRCVVRSGQSIVDAAAAAGVQIGTSCGEGFCGSCQTTVLDGIPDHRDSVLSERERAANHCLMPCVSRCQGNRLVLDL